MCFGISFSACECKFVSFSQTAATNETRAGISLKYARVSSSSSPFTSETLTLNH